MTNINFLVKNISSNMFSQVAEGKVSIDVDRTSTSIEDLKKVKNLRSSLSNKGLEGTLRNLGINFSPLNNPKFQVRLGDVIYVIIPSEKINQYENKSELPETIRLTVEKWTIGKKSPIWGIIKKWKKWKKERIGD